MIIDGTNITMVKGDTETIQLETRDSNHLKVDLVSGDKVYMTVKRDASLVEKEFQIIVTTFTNGTADIDILPEHTKNMEHLYNVYDIQVTYADGTIKTVVPHSLFILKDEVTHE